MASRQHHHIELTISAPALEALGRDLINALAPCGSVTQSDIDHMTVTLTRSSDKLAAALKKATKET